jgi:hypothetical protein
MLKPFSSDFPRLYSLPIYVQEIFGWPRNFLPRRLLAGSPFFKELPVEASRSDKG